METILRYLARATLALGIVLLGLLIYLDIRDAVRIRGDREAAKAKVEGLKLAIEKNQTDPRFAAPPRDPSQASGRALQAWNDIPPSGSFHWYDFYPSLAPAGRTP